MGKNEQYMVVANTTGPIALRHIVTVKEYDPVGFRRWYNDQYHELKGDMFIFRQNYREMLETAEKWKYWKR